MSQTPYPLSITKRNFGVVALAGAKHLSESDLNVLAYVACDELRQHHKTGHPITRQIVQCGDFTAAVMEENGGYKMFIGLGLEVIQAIHK